MRGPCSALYDGRFTLDFELQINKRSSTKKNSVPYTDRYNNSSSIVVAVFEPNISCNRTCRPILGLSGALFSLNTSAPFIKVSLQKSKLSYIGISKTLAPNRPSLPLFKPANPCTKSSFLLSTGKWYLTN